MEKQIKDTEDKSDAVRSKVRLLFEVVRCTSNYLADNPGPVPGATTRRSGCSIVFDMLLIYWRPVCALLGV